MKFTTSLETLDRVFRDDPGLDGVIVDAPKVGAWMERYERTWLKVLIAMHGSEWTSTVYSFYAADRSRNRPERIQSWSDLEPDFQLRWNRDRHGFACHCCGGAPWRVVGNGAPLCGECAQGEGIDPDGAVPVWRSAAHSLIVSPGLRVGEEPPPPPQFMVRFADGDKTFNAGEATPLLAADPAIIPGLTILTGRVDGETSALRVEVSADFSTAVSASFSYKEEGYVLEHGVVSAPGMDAVETADVYELIDVALKAALPAEEASR